MQDQASAMSDGDEANADEAALADKHEVKLVGKQKKKHEKKKQDEQQSAGRKRKKNSKGGLGTHSKRRNGGSAKKGAHAKHARASDWTSDDSSDAQPEKIIDNLEPMSESDVDSQEGSRPGAAAKITLAPSLGKQNKQQVAKKTSLAQPLSTSSPTERDPHRVLPAEAEEEWGQPAVPSDNETQPAQQAKRKGRLRKARASPGPKQHATAGSEDGDLMVDLEDDLPEIEMEREGASQKTSAGSQDSKKEALRHADKHRDK